MGDDSMRAATRSAGDYFGAMMTDTTLRIRKIMRNNPDMTDAQIARKIGRDDVAGRERVQRERLGDEYCPKSKDGLGHCICWWDCESCCWCKSDTPDNPDCDCERHGGLVMEDTRSLRGVECGGCQVSLSEWKDEEPYTECPLCGGTELARTDWGG